MCLGQSQTVYKSIDRTQFPAELHLALKSLFQGLPISKCLKMPAAWVLNNCFSIIFLICKIPRKILVLYLYWPQLSYDTAPYIGMNISYSLIVFQLRFCKSCKILRKQLFSSLPDLSQAKIHAFEYFLYPNCFSIKIL